MDSLPQELIDRISSFLSRNDLKRTLFVSRKFQHAAERYSGAFSVFTFWKGRADEWRIQDITLKELNSMEDKCKKFVEMYSGRRLRYLRVVEVHTSFPPQKGSINMLEVHDPDYRHALPCRENTQAIRKKDELFSEQIRQVFNNIKTVEHRAALNGFGPGKIQLTILTPIQWISGKYCNHQVYSAWRIHLLDPTTLPALLSIRGLSVCNPGWKNEYGLLGRPARARIDLRMIIDLATRLPNIEYLGCELGTGEWRNRDEDLARSHFERDFEACQRDARKDSSEALNNAVLPVSLRHVQLDFLTNLGVHYKEQRGGGPDLVSPAPYDPFSSSLRRFSGHLRRLELRVIADRTLFWPSGRDEPTCWPNLESIEIMFHPCSPSGSWYFQGPKGEGRDDTGYPVTDSMYPPLEDNQYGDIYWHGKDLKYSIVGPAPYFRIVPNGKTLGPFLEAFAKAAANMHALDQAVVWAPVRVHQKYEYVNRSSRNALVKHSSTAELAWCIVYSAPNTQRPIYTSAGNHYSESRTIWWEVGPWQPDHKLHELFRNIGAAKHGGEMVEFWSEDLPDQEMFSYESSVFGVRRGTYRGLYLAPTYE